MNRRALLSAAGVAVAPLAGCIGGNSRDAVVNTAEQSPTDDAEVISYADLPGAEQQIAKTAVEEEFYHACPNLPDALYSFSERFSTIDSSYLRYQGTAYGLWIRIQDTIRVDTAPTPDSDPSCGIL
ncbi:hypothetical protein [Haloplanus salinus]|uniref:hypothetical protein n=1 Tax=Haloplanus salinus TaxID=1126245 RepID=UPI0011C06D20|nr:hypothetical protein [Haloplanus salinus]